MTSAPYPVLTEAQLCKLRQRIDTGPADRCHPWLGKSKQRSGQGITRIEGRLLTVPKLIWVYHHGPVPPRQKVYATCGDQGCCNPAHLACGTKSASMLNASRSGSKLGRGVDYEGPDLRPKQVAKPYPTLTEKQTRAFWAKVDKLGPDECWIWQGSGGRGYRTFRAAGRNLIPSRLSYALANGDAPTHLDVCHSCDDPRCVNPAHLYAGTRRRNARDMVEKGRCNAARGVRAGKAKLKPEQVYEIRRRYDEGEAPSLLGIEFDLRPQSIAAIGLRKSWKHLPEVQRTKQARARAGG